MPLHFWNYLKTDLRFPHIAAHVPGPALWYRQKITLQQWLVKEFGLPSKGRWTMFLDQYKFINEADMLYFVMTWNGVEIPYAQLDDEDRMIWEELLSARHTG